jgi:glycosyltransferase involved in cell wall biosynthesis
VKILYVCSDSGIPVLGRKGASVHVRELVAAFRRAGHAVVVAAATQTKSPWEEPATLEATLLRVRASRETTAVVAELKAYTTMLDLESPLPGHLRRVLYNEDLASDLKRRFQADPPDFVYERASLYGTAGVSLAQVLDVPLLLEVNAPLADEQSAYRAASLGDLAREAERWTLTRADAVLAVSALLRDYVVSLDVQPERVHVVPNGVDPTVFRPGPPDPGLRARLHLDGRPVLGFVGGLRPWHGVEALPPLLEQLVERHSGLRLIVVGNGSLRTELERDFAHRGLAPHVTFTGSLPHEQVAGVIRQFHAALAPYPRLEHAFYFSPLKLFEYMACGVPVVAAELGQIGEVVRDGETGLLYPPGELDAFVDACDRLLADPPMQRRLGAAAAGLVRSTYTWDRNAAQVVGLAGSLIEARVGR